LFLVLLRVAIGWHFLNEGLEKYESRSPGKKPFSAEVYLRYSTGPLAPYFRALVPDVNGLAKLDPPRLKASWEAEVRRVGGHFGFDDDQRSKADSELKASEQFADLWFADRETAEKRAKYYHELGMVQAVERNPAALSFERERAASKRKDLDADRRDLTKEIDARGEALREAVTKLSTAEQLGSVGPYYPAKTDLDRINDLTTLGLIAMGLGLMLGAFTRPAALAAAVFLGQIYLSMPPWPGLPPSPTTEGHYYIVSKNLIEMIACLALVFLPTGYWIGVDALLFGWARRRRERRAEAAEAPADAEPAGPRGRRSHTNF